MTFPSAHAPSRFAAVVVNYNGGSMLSAAVGSLVAAGVPPGRVVVVDNGSRDASIWLALEAVPGIALIHNPGNAGFARAVNQGLQCLLALSAPAPDFILLLNSDAELAPDAPAAFAAAFDRDPTLAIAGGRLIYPDGRRQATVAPLPTLAEELVPRSILTRLRPGRFDRILAAVDPTPVESVIGACLAVRSTALAFIGLLDEAFFFYFEETEWCHRARAQGWNVAYVPAAGATHGQAVTANRFWKGARVELQRSKLLYFRKTHAPAEAAIVSAILPLRALTNAVFNSVACFATLGLHRRLRAKTTVYWYLLAWHLAGRPAAWGLPDKLPPASNSVSAV